MALTAERQTPKMASSAVAVVPVKAGVKIYNGALVVIDAGYAKPGVSAAGLISVGRANQTRDNTGGGNGDLTVEVQRGVFKYANHGINTVVAANLFGTAYVEDDQTVGNLSTDKSAAGKIVQIDSDGVWVEFA